MSVRRSYRRSPHKDHLRGIAATLEGATKMDQFAGQTVGRYRLERLIGKGGMASVYRAFDPTFQRQVAIKLLSPQLARDQQFVERFLREGRSMGRLQHPHIVPVYDGGQDGNNAYLVMQFVDGGNLYDRLAAARRNGRMAVNDILAFLQPVADALDVAHRQGLVHRDVKPQNILLTEQGYPYLTDFGIAKAISADFVTATLTQANTVIGTPEYMSPEQAQGGEIDGRSDLYALGVILYEAFTGRTPFRVETTNDTPLTILVRHASVVPPQPRIVNPQISPAVEDVLLRALAKTPAARYPTGAALCAALRTALATPPVTPPMIELAGTSGQNAAQPSRPQLTPLPVLPSITPPPSPSGNFAPTTGQSYAGPNHSGTYPMGSGPIPTGSGPIQMGSGPVSLAATPAAAPVPSRRRASATTMVSAGAGVALIVVLILVALLIRQRQGTSLAGVQATASPAGTIVAAAPSAAPTSAAATATPPAPTATVPVASLSPTLAPRTSPPAVASPAIAVPTTPPGGTAGATTREAIYFSSHRNDVHDSQIYTMNPDGSGQRQVTFTRGHSWGPRFSPNGRFFVFSSVAPGEHDNHGATGGGEAGQGHHEIYRANSDGSNIVRLTTTTAWNNAWAWSPDSQSLIFASDRDGNWELYRMNANGEQIVRLTNNPAQDGWPSYTPDGKQIVFASNREGGLSQIYIMNADGSNARRLTQSGTNDTLPSVSPDGKRIVYSAQTSPSESEIYAMNIDGTNPTRLTSSVAVNTDPSWSPDGKRIVFASDRDGNSNIYAMQSDGKDLKRLTDDPGEDVTPFWINVVVGVAPPDEIVAAVPCLTCDAIVPTRRQRW